MRKISFYPKLALINIKSNRRLYFPYLLTCIFTVAMFYIVLFIRYNDGLANVIGGQYVGSYMMFGSVIIGIFSLVILFYTNSFLMKRRRRELGLYNILGMEKRHIASVMLFETLFTGVGTIAVGIVTGIVLSKLVYMLLLKLINLPVALGMSISVQGIISTCTLFACIFLLILVYNLWHIRLSKPIELLHGDQVGQKEPKTKALLAIFGAIALAGGYVLAIQVKSPIDAILWFFIAVILVIIGTYCLFTAGSIALLKIMRSNKSYYYKTKHFISVSSMIYRMKQNAVGLANICILSTMVLVTVSTTATLYAGMSDYINALYPYEINMRFTNPEDATLETYASLIQDAAAREGYDVTASTWYEYWMTPVTYNGHRIEAADYDTINGYLFLMTQEEYARATGQSYELADDEVLLYVNEGETWESDITLLGEKFRVKAYPEKAISQLKSAGMAEYTVAMAVVPDEETLQQLTDASFQQIEEYRTNRSGYVGLSFDAGEEEKRAFCDRVCQIPMEENRGTDFTNAGYESLSIESRQRNADDYYAMYGAFLFLGIFLGLLFLMATILIMYYKQVTEGYDDRERFAILQKVGMSPAEVKSSIRSQVLTVFFLPLTVAGIHICFAFPMIVKIIMAFGLNNVPLFMISTAATFILFALIYMLVYTLTARVYYRIVR